MPYYLHAKDAEPNTGTPFADMPTARAAMTKGQTVTFEASDEECARWWRREQERYADDTYQIVPWIADRHCIWSSSRFPYVTHRHYPHISVADPGLIAYTKNDEHGIADRQTRVRPGRYLEEYFKDVFTPEQIAEYVDRCKAVTGTLQIARSTADIVAIYSRKDCGFSSCMQFKRNPEYDWQRATERGDRQHPCAVYGESDLGVAYLGDITTGITARAVVWPDKLRYARVYGDSTLAALLRANGYDQGSLEGARVRYIESGQGVIMPYIDGVGYARDGERGWIVLDNDASTYDCRSVDGYGDGSTDTDNEDSDDCDNGERDTQCEHCSDWFCYGDQGNSDLNRHWCDECLARRIECADCNALGWDYTYYEGARYCDDCYEALRHTCAGEIPVTRSGLVMESVEYHYGTMRPCTTRWFEDSDFTADERADRILRRVTHLCADCAKQLRACAHCSQTFDTLDMACPHCGLSVRCDETPDLFESVRSIAQQILCGPSPIDGSIWWASADADGPRTYLRDTRWVLFPDGRTRYVSVERIDVDPAWWGRSTFDTLDNHDLYRRVPDPRLPLLESVF